MKYTTLKLRFQIPSLSLHTFHVYFSCIFIYFQDGEGTDIIDSIMMESCRKDVILVNIIFFLYKSGESMLDTSTRQYILKAVCNRNYPLNISCCLNIEQFPDVEDYIQKQSGIYLIFYRIIINAPAVVLGLFCGAFSDRYGRKIPMILPSIGSILGVCFYIASLFYLKLQLPLIMVGASLQGISGKSTIITMAVNSYISDITEKDERIQKLGSLLATTFFGMFVGSFLSGVIQDVANLLVTYCTVMFLHASFILLTTTCLRESLKSKEKTQIGISTLSLLFKPTNVKESIGVLTKKRQKGRRLIVLIMFLITLVNQVCKVGEQDVTILFVTRSPLSWPKSWYGYLLSLDYAVMGICLLCILPYLSIYLNMSDAAILILGLCCRIIRLTWAAFATTSWMVFVSVIIGAFSGMMTSAVRSLVSKSVSENEAGKLFSLLACTETASKIFGVVTFVNIYSMTAEYFPGASYICEALLFVGMLILVICIYKSLKTIGIYEIVHDTEEDCIDVKTSCSIESLSSSESLDDFEE